MEICLSDSREEGRDNVVRLGSAPRRRGGASRGAGVVDDQSLEVLRLALGDLRRGIRSRVPKEREASASSVAEGSGIASDSARWATSRRDPKRVGEIALAVLSEIASEVDWLELFDRLRSSASTLGMGDRVDDVDAFGFDSQLLASTGSTRNCWRARDRCSINSPGAIGASK